jgi:hypothetical protein
MEEQTKKEEPVQRKTLWGKQMPFLQFVALSRIAVNKIQISPLLPLAALRPQGALRRQADAAENPAGSWRQR